MITVPSDHHVAGSKTNYDMKHQLHAAGIESGSTLPFIHKENTSVGSNGHDGVAMWFRENRRWKIF